MVMGTEVASLYKGYCGKGIMWAMNCSSMLLRAQTSALYIGVCETYAM